jgi:4-alpha-glucanotransferase
MAVVHQNWVGLSGLGCSVNSDELVENTGEKQHELFHKRRAGVLLHPTSLPLNSEDGFLGEAADRFLDFLVDAGFSVWQMLPVQPVNDHGSPYQCGSVHAGNAQLISQQRLNNYSWMHNAGSASDSNLITKALGCFQRNASDAQKQKYVRFKREQDHWLENYALYSAIKSIHKNSPWWEWSYELKIKNKKAIRIFQQQHGNVIEHFIFEQYLFFSQWQELRRKAAAKGLLLFGDMPIFTAHDSADVWGHRDYFQLDKAMFPSVVAGVPPDYFSVTGQRWGNPLYDWQAMRRARFQWWVERLKTQLTLFDLVRLDHFRGFEAVWEIPASCATAVEGEWREVPGRELLQTLHDSFGDLPLIAEDLGIISDGVIKLRKDFRLLGIKVLQFAFDNDASNPYLPHNHELDYLVSTGTHDNNTTLGWFNDLNDLARARIQEYLQNPVEPMPWPLIRACLASVCKIAILPMQDLLELDSGHRMNTPGTTEGNWQWRFSWGDINSELMAKLKHLNEIYGRC